MNELVQDSNGRWIIRNIYITGLTDSVKFDIKLTYKGISCQINGVTKDAYDKNVDTGWITPLGEAIKISDIQFESAPVYSQDGRTKYIVTGLTFNSETYNPVVSGDTKPEESVVEGLTVGVASYKVIIDEIPKLTNQGKIKPTANYIVYVDGVETNRTKIEDGVWDTSKTETAWFDDDGYLNYSNTGYTTQVVDLTCVYNGISGKITIMIGPNKKRTDPWHTLTLTAIVSGGSSEPYPYIDEYGIINLIAEFDGANVTSAATWYVSNPIAKVWPFATSAPVTWLNTYDTEQTVQIFAKYNDYESDTYSFRVGTVEGGNGEFKILPSSDDCKTMVFNSAGEMDFKAYFTLGEIHDQDVTSQCTWSVDNSNIAVIDNEGHLKYSNNYDETQVFSVKAKYHFVRDYTESTRISVCAKNAKTVKLKFYVTPTGRTEDTEHPYGFVRVPLPATTGFIIKDFDEYGEAEIDGAYQVGTTLMYTVTKDGYYNSVGSYIVKGEYENGIQVDLISKNGQAEITKDLLLVMTDRDIKYSYGSTYMGVFERTFVNGVLVSQQNVSRDAVFTSDSPMYKKKTYNWWRMCVEFENTNTKAAETINFTVTYDGMTIKDSFKIARKTTYDVTSSILVVTDQKTRLPSNGFTPEVFAYQRITGGGGAPIINNVSKGINWVYDDFGTGIVTGSKKTNESYYCYYNNTTMFDIPLLIEGVTNTDKDGVLLIIPGITNASESQTYELARLGYTTGSNLVGPSATTIKFVLDSNTNWRVVFLSSIRNVEDSIVDIDWIHPETPEGSMALEELNVNVDRNDTGYERSCFMAIQSTVTGKMLDILYINQNG